MVHEVYKVKDFERLAPYILRITFDDETDQIIDFWPILKGEVFGELRDLELFNQVSIDPEFETLVWPNEADFDPETLHNWPQYEGNLIKMASKWEDIPKTHYEREITDALVEKWLWEIFSSQLV